MHTFSACSVNLKEIFDLQVSKKISIVIIWFLVVYQILPFTKVKVKPYNDTFPRSSVVSLKGMKSVQEVYIYCNKSQFNCAYFCSDSFCRTTTIDMKISGFVLPWLSSECDIRSCSNLNFQVQLECQSQACQGYR